MAVKFVRRRREVPVVIHGGKSGIGSDHQVSRFDFLQRVDSALDARLPVVDEVVLASARYRIIMEYA